MNRNETDFRFNSNKFISAKQFSNIHYFFLDINTFTNIILKKIISRYKRRY